MCEPSMPDTASDHQAPVPRGRRRCDRVRTRPFPGLASGAGSPHRLRRGAGAVCLLVLWAGVVRPAGAQELDGMAAAAAMEAALIRAIEGAEPSVVAIARVKPAPARSEFNERPNPPFPMLDPLREQENPESLEFVPTDFGTGVVIAVEGPQDPHPRRASILTNYHVVKGGSVEGPSRTNGVELYVRLANHRVHKGRIWAADPRSDLAVVVIDDADVRPIRFGDGGRLRKGNIVIALGNPYAVARDGSASASWGIVSNLGRRPEFDAPAIRESDLRDETIHHLGTLLHIDTRLQWGGSGGALVNLQGELVGITTSLAALVGYEKSVGYAIPLDDSTRRTIRTLLEGKEVEYGFLGIYWNQGSRFPMRPMPPLPASAARVGQGLFVETVFANSPAFRGGMLPGDVILSINDRPILSRSDLTREVSRLPPGTTVRIKVQRAQQSEPVTLLVELGKWPVRNDEDLVVSRYHFEPWRGIVADYATARARYNTLTHTDSFPSAVLVTTVLPDSRGAAAEVKEGMYISQVQERAVSTPAEFYRAVQGLSGDVVLTLLDGQRIVVRGP